MADSSSNSGSGAASSNPLLDELKRLHDLETQGRSGAGQQAAQSEIAGLVPNLYEVAANADVQGLDPSGMGQVERMLRSRDTAGLRALLGEQQTQDLLGKYQAARQEVRADKSADRSVLRAISDAGLGVVDGVGSAVLGLSTLMAQPMPTWVSPEDSPLRTGRLLNQWNGLFTPLYSDELKAHRRVAAALNAPDERAHQLEAENAWFHGDSAPSALSDLGIAVRRMGKDAWTSMGTMVQDPTLLAQGVAESAASIISAAGIQSKLGAVGRVATRKTVQKLEAETVARELGRLAVTGVDAQAANTSARALAAEAAKKFTDKLDRAAAAVAVSSTEGASAFEQASASVLNADPQELLKNSPDFAAEVGRLKVENPGLSDEVIYQKAKNILAPRAGRVAAVLTGAGAGAIGAVFPENVIKPWTGASPARTAAGSIAKDAIKEFAEEGGQSFLGGLVNNAVAQRYVDQNQDLLAGVGAETGTGALLGPLSVVSMKGANLARGLLPTKTKAPVSPELVNSNDGTDEGGGPGGPGGPTDLSSSGNSGGNGPGNIITNRADRLRNEMMASSPGTLPNLAAEARDLAAAPDANANLPAYVKTVVDAVADPAAKQAASDKLIGLYDAPVVAELPASLQNVLSSLAPEVQSQLKPQMDRATAANVVAEAYNQEADAGKKAQLGLALTELLQPVQEFKALPAEFGPLLAGRESSSQQDVLRRQKHLQRIEMLPAVQQAQKTLTQTMGSQTAQTVAQLTPETIQGPEGLAAAQVLATQAQTDPSLGGKVTSDQVEQIYLAHGTGGTNSLTEKQRNALQASRVALRALEDAAQLRTGGNPDAAAQIMQNHVLGQKDMASVGQQATIEMSQTYIQNGKFSGKQHVSRIINRILAGDWTRAQAFMVRYGNFIQSENNKLRALNDAYTTGKDQSYLQYDPTSSEPNRFMDSATNPKSKFPRMFVRLDPKNIAQSMKLARSIETEANFLTNFYNDLRQAFPELKAPAIENVALHPDLATGPVDSTEMQARQNKIRQQSIIARREAGMAAAREQAGQNSAPDAAPVTDRNSSVDTNSAMMPEPVAPSDSATTVVSAPVEAQTAPQSSAVSESLPTPIAPAEQVTEAATETELARDPAKTSLQDLYPGLARSENRQVEGYFNKVFKPAVTKAGEFMSRLMGVDDPVGAISTALDKAPVSLEIRRAYQKLLAITPGLKKRMENYLARGKPAKLASELQNVGGIATAMQFQLAAFLQEEWKDGITWEQAIREGRANVTAMSKGKAINLVEMRGTGSNAKLGYNLELLTAGILAGFQWHLVTSTRAKRSFDSKVTDDAVMDDPGQETDLSEGMSTAEAKNSLAQYLTRFWGIKGDPKEGIGFTDGLPEAFAAELIRALETVQLVRMEKIIFRDPETGKPVDTPERYFSIPWDEDVNGQRIEDHPLYQQPDLLEELVVVEPEQRYFWGTESESAKVPVKETQHSNPNVRLSAKTKQAVRNMQQQQFFMNPTMWKALSGLTEDQIVQLFGYELSGNAEQFMNKMDLDAKQGANVALRGAFKQFQRDLQQMERIAAEKGIPVEQVARQYQYGVTAVNRFMMLGSYNPQANKLMRELMMPTWATLDVSEDSQGYQHMLLAVAQALGRKVHTFGLTGNEKSNVAWMQQQMEGPLKPVLDLLVRHLEQKDQLFSAGDYMAAMDAVRIDGKKLNSSPLIMMALLELARWKQLESSPEARKQFRTPLYLEADGMTNGPFNSIGLLSTGRITVEQLEAAARGGLNVSSTAITADQSVDKDNYQASMDAAGVAVSQASVRIGETGPQFTNVTDSTFNVLGLLLGGEVKRDKAGNVTLTRAFGKNPITVLIYGSGVKGVAGKVADRLTKAFYEKLSLLAQAQGEGLSGREALARMFPEESDPAVASAQGLQLLRALQNTMSERLWYDRKKGEYRLDTRFPSNLLQRVKTSPQNFEFTAEEIDALQTNLRHLVISPMYAGIQQTIGETVFQSRELLVQATKIHANTARLMFYKAIDAKMQAKAAAKAAELKKARPQEDAKALEAEAKAFVSNEFLSREELSQIIDELGKIMPMVSSDQQNFMIAKNQLLAFVDSKGKPAEKYITSRAFDDTMRTTPAIKAVADPAVAGVPYMVIGMGDGRMVRQIFENLMGNTMQVYDGINIPLDKVQEYGNRINQAALHAWQGNVFRDIQASYYEMFKDPRVMQSLMTDDRFVQAMDTVIFPWNQETNVQKARERLIKSFKQIYGQLRQATLEIQARRVAFSRFPISMDQMSSTYSPHVTEGKLELPAELGARDFEIREKLLNAEYEKVLAQLQAGQWIEPEVRVPVRAALDAAPVATASVTETAANPNQSADTNTQAIPESEPKPAPAELPGKDLQGPAETPAPGQQPLPTEVLARARDTHSSGVKIAGIENLADLVQTLKDSLLPSEQGVLQDLLRSKLLKGITIVAGTREQVQQYQEMENQSSLAAIEQMQAGKQLFGFYDPTAHTIFLMNPKVETLLHELVHAGTYALLEAHYQGQAVPAESQAAIQRLETLMRAFMQTDHGLDPDSQVGRALQSAQNEISRHQPALDDPSPAQKAAMLNEFMAWTLSNRDLAAQLAQASYDTENNQTVEMHYEQTAPVSKKSLLPARLLQIWEAAKNAILRLIGKKRNLSSLTSTPSRKSGPSILSEIQFNTSAIVSGTESISRMYQSNALAHAELTGLPVPARLEKIREAFNRSVARYLNQTYEAAWLQDLPTNPLVAKPLMLAREVANTAGFHFEMDALERETFRTMVMALATNARINPQSLTELSRVYGQFLKTVALEDFLADPQTTDQNARSKAQKQFEFVTGLLAPQRDELGRSTALSVFLALGTVNEEFRQVLAKKTLALPAGQPIQGMDSLVDRLWQGSMQLLEKRLSGMARSGNMAEAVDQLNQQVVHEVLRTRNILENLQEGAQKGLHGLNSKMRKLFNRVGTGAYRQGQNLTGTSKSRFKRSLQSALTATAVLTSQQSADAVSEDFIARMDKQPEMSHFLRELFGPDGLLGRTQSLGKVYDMVKKVRAVVEQSRQAYRKHLPFTILSKFKMELNESQHDLLYRFAGRSDLASLLQLGRTTMDALKLVSDRTARKQEMLALENKLQALVPDAGNLQLYQDKIQQLVEFMHTGKYGVNLLPNAHAIAGLFDTAKNTDAWAAPTEELVQVIDQLTTLKYLDQFSLQEQQEFALLVRGEPEGVEFALSYLKGLRSSEMTKALDARAKYNHVKGQLPSETNGGHLTVVADNPKKHLEMTELGYARVGEYIGSGVEASAPALAYYYSPDGGTETAINQGLIQNVQGTAYGVRTGSGFPTGPNAGFITDPDEVQELVGRMDAQRAQGEELFPIRNDQGEIIAFQRTLDPQLMRRLQKPQNLAQIIGHWAGRQMEESLAGAMNEQLLEHLSTMYHQDIARSPANADMYENVLVSKDPIIQDMLRIMPKDLQKKIEQAFGEGQFFVRRSLLNQVIGSRQASVGDLWTGNTRYSPEFQKLAKDILMAVFGKNAYRRLTNMEKNWQAFVGSRRTNIVVRSMVVPVANTLAGLYQLKVRGVPLVKIASTVPRKLAEIEYYTQSMAEKIRLEAELYAHESSPEKATAIQQQLANLDDSLKRLSIAPLIAAGEFSAIADVGTTREAVDGNSTTLMDRMEDQVYKLPAPLRDTTRQLYLAQDTSLFQVLKKGVQNSDFIMKAVYYDHLLENEQEFLEQNIGYLDALKEAKQQTALVPEAEKLAREAIARSLVTEEFNNYDLPTGRNRGYLESMGLMWFLNYPIRATKVAFSIARNNPLDLLLFGLLPHPMAAGLPVTDNIYAKLFDGSLLRLTGPGLLTRPIAWNAWYNLFGN